ncbi:MAG: tetratricopeptide repeat protein [Longimicrobiales bacterium]
MLPRAARLAALLLCVAVAAPAGRVAAQVTPSQVSPAQVSPADSAEVLLDAASRFSSQGRHDVADALYRLIAERFPSTPAAEVARLRLGAARAAGTAGSGRVELQVWSTLYGLWLGIAVPGALGADESEPYGLGLLLGGPAGFFAGKQIAGSRDLTEGQARAITLGGTWGTWQGFGWAEVLDLGQEEVCFDDEFGRNCYDEGDSSEEKFAAMILGGVAGIAAGAALSSRPISPGVATAVNFGSLWGTWFGFGFGYLADLEEDALLAATLLGGNVGLAATALKAPDWNPTRSRARIVSIYGVIGGLSGLGVDLLTQPDDEKVAMAIPLAGSIAGLALGMMNTRRFDAAEPAPAGTPPGGALLNLSEGNWRLGAPLPHPRVLELDGPRGLVRRPALGLTLVHARFF